jgi:hypothetical protein
MFRVDCRADCGADEMYTADERKMAAPPPKQKVMSVLWYWETNSQVS